MTGEFVSSTGALRAAASIAEQVRSDPELGHLAMADRGDPVLVRTLTGSPSYWLVPLRADDTTDRIVGFVRVLSNGDVGAVGRYGGVTPLSLGPDDVVADIADILHDGEVASEPMLVHDGPPGREAWLVATHIGGVPARMFFVTPAGTYQRSWGQA